MIDSIQLNFARLDKSVMKNMRGLSEYVENIKTYIKYKGNINALNNCKYKMNSMTNKNLVFFDIDLNSWIHLSI